MAWKAFVLTAAMWAVLVVLSALLLRRRPLVALALPLAGALALPLAPGQMQLSGLRPILPVVLVGIEVCYIAATRPRRVSVVAAGLALGVLTADPYVPAHFGDPDVPAQLAAPIALVIALTTVVAWLAGHSIQQAHRHAEALRAQAATSERLRIARELHDMVAHSIGIIAIQAGVGSRVIGTQPVEARNALDAIEATSRQTLAGLRQMLGSLRRAEPGADPAPMAPAPGLADLDRLARTMREAGVQVDVRWRGKWRPERDPLPAEVDLSAFRILQEAVTNVARHAGTGRCRICVERRDEELFIEVSDDGRGGDIGPTGYGIAGMRERAILLSGQLTAGPRPGGGFRVAARLPVPAAARRPVPATAP
jgi:signal transduction histidine kinase